MSLVALWGAFEIGMIYALVAMGVFISFRILDFPDLTADGSFPLGGAVAAAMIVGGWNPWVATIAAGFSGGIAGFLTGFFNVKLRILKLLASILVMTALYSINLRIMGGPNIPLLGEATVFSSLSHLITFVSDEKLQTYAVVVITLIIMLLINYFFSTRTGLAMRATGANERMSKAQGVSTGSMVLLGMSISNALIALGGALFVQTQGGSDISMGTGTIVIGLAAVIIGETIIPGRSIWVATLSAIIGSLIYRFFFAVALESDFIGLDSQDMNLVTAALIAIALVLPIFKRKWHLKLARSTAHREGDQ